MKKVLFFLSGTLLLANLFVSTGCGEDDTPTTNTPPLVTVSLSSASLIAPSEDIAFSVTADVGTDQLASMTITEDDGTGAVNVDAARITIENIATANNPQLITATDKDGLVWNITIAGSATPGDYNYEVSVTDDGGLSDSDVTGTITVEEPIVTTPIDMDISGVLFNQGGPVGTGGLDLDAGVGTGSADADAEIRDWGIDSALPAADNWLRKIGAANNHTMRFINQTSEIFDFAAVSTIEEIADAWSKGEDLVGNESPIVITGDVFVVENFDTGRLYLIQIDEVNVKPDMGDNGDNYVVSIKY